MTERQSAAPEVTAPPWHALDGEAVLARLGVTRGGLGDAEVAERRARFGRNEIREAEPVRPLAILVAQFRSLLVALLVAAGIVSGALGEWIDTAAILAIVVLNAGIGFAQEWSAARSIAALRRMTAPRAKVRRAGKMRTVDAVEIVPGDVVLLEAGDLVAADLRLMDAASLRTVEAALTGESEPADKSAEAHPRADAALGDRANMAFLGTSVAAGCAEGVAVATGMGTELGRIASLLHDTAGEEPTPLQVRLRSVGRLLVGASVAIVVLLFGLGILRGEPFGEMALTAISLAVAAVPEGLPAVVTVALALGVVRMARRRALLRRLPAVETLGSASVICSDKTGTLTVGEMTVRALHVAGETFEVTGEGYAPEGEIRAPEGVALAPRQAERVRDLAHVLVGCNGAHLEREEREGGEASAWVVVGDPTEGALLAAGAKGGITREGLDRDEPVLRTWPFDSDRKRMSVLRHRRDGATRALVKGAPDALLPRCTHVRTAEGVRAITEEDRAAIGAELDRMSSRALRVLAAAWRDLSGDAPPETSPEEIERDLVFAGLAGMVDPPRPSARDAVARCREAGVRVVMITGDHPRTALAVAREIGIAGADDEALAGAELDRLSPEELAARAPRVAVYARVTAAHKLAIVRAWKSNGAVVAMTGDGVNDAPALQGADIGVAMGRTGTEVTKEAADMIVTDDDFASIVAAVEEGRGVYENIRKTLQFLLAGNSGELLLMTACIVSGLPLPLLPIHLLWINLVTDGLPALCLATDPIDDDVMRRPPRRASERLTDRRFLGTMLLTGVLTAGVSLAVFVAALRATDAATARTYAFSVLVFAELFRAFGARSETKWLGRIGLLSNARLAVVVAISFAFQLAIVRVPVLGHVFRTGLLSWSECLAMAALGLVPLVVLELRKAWSRRRDDAAPAAASAGFPAPARIRACDVHRDGGSYSLWYESADGREIRVHLRVIHGKNARRIGYRPPTLESLRGAEPDGSPPATLSWDDAEALRDALLPLVGSGIELGGPSRASEMLELLGLRGAVS